MKCAEVPSRRSFLNGTITKTTRAPQKHFCECHESDKVYEYLTAFLPLEIRSQVDTLCEPNRVKAVESVFERAIGAALAALQTAGASLETVIEDFIVMCSREVDCRGN